MNNGESFGPEKERERMLDETTVAMSLEKLRMVNLIFKFYANTP